MKIPLLIHATHEAGVKVGGIGAVLDGLLGSPVYSEEVEHSILVGPMAGWDPIEMERLTSPRNGLTIHYSSLHGIFDGVTSDKRLALQKVEQTFQVGLLYGERKFAGHSHEVVLVDATNPNMQQVNAFRFYLWQHFGIDSGRYQHDSEFNLYFSIAQPLFAALKALNVDYGMAPNDKFILAHEWLGMPVVFAAQMSEPGQWRTIFYAHEMATARRLVEENSGHDTRFYNAMFKAADWNLSLEAVFGNQDDLYKTPILRQAAVCDNIFSVGDLVTQELRFMSGGFYHANIDLVYNGVPSFDISLEEKLISKARMQQYGENLFGFRPDYVFTHVTRMVLSKGMWRDLRVLEHLAPKLQAEGKSAVLFILSTSVPAGRKPEWVEAWEQQYGWPVGHRGDNGDLIGQETSFFFDGIEPFNQRFPNVKVVLINQFGWSRERCGQRMPADMEFMDIRKGSDLEFGQSIYEPFGIAQVEPLSFGAICCVSNVCGCVGFVERVTGDIKNVPNVVVADYVTLPWGYWLNSPYDALTVDGGTRGHIEGVNSAQAAQDIFDVLPRTEDEMETLLEKGQEIARGMSWDVVVKDYLVPALNNARK